MPTLNEVWEQAVQVNANLVTLHNDVVALQGCCQTVNARLNDLIILGDETNEWLEELRQITDAGFVATSKGLAAVLADQAVTIHILAHQVKQNEAVICSLEKISANTCALLNQAVLQTDLQTQMAVELQALRHMFATANPAAALVYDRFAEERRKLEECCPPGTKPPVCIYERCPVPKDLEVPQLGRFEPYDGQQTKVQRHDLLDDIK